MRRIYVAGPYSAPSVLEGLENIRAGIRASREIFEAGDAPFCPWLDFLFVLVRDDGGRQMTVEDYYAYSLKWLEVSDAVVVLPGWERSQGTLKEIKAAEARAIPVYTFEEWREWKRQPLA